jgi:hypothetical protein
MAERPLEPDPGNAGGGKRRETIGLIISDRRALPGCGDFFVGAEFQIRNKT